MNFPQYKKLLNEKSWYKIESSTRMVEVVVIGKSYMVHQLDAKILPERNLIMDLMANEGGRWIEISKNEFESFVEKCERELTKRL